MLLNTSGLAPLSPPSKKAKAGIIERLFSKKVHSTSTDTHPRLGGRHVAFSPSPIQSDEGRITSNATKVDSTSTDAHPQLGGRHVAFSPSPIRPDEGHITRNAYKTPLSRPRAQIKPAHKTNAGSQGPQDAAGPSNMAASASNRVPTSQASTSDTSTSEQKYAVEDHKPTTSTPAGAKGPANLSVRHLFKLMDKHSHKTTPAVPTTNVANPNLNYIGYDAGFAHFLDLLNRGKSGATLSASDVMNNYELGQSHARDLQVLLHGQVNASSSPPPPPEMTREPPMVMMTSPQPTTPSVEIWEESMISPSPEDEPPIPVTPHRDQTPNKKEPPHRPAARPSSSTPKPKRWIPRHAVEMEYKSLRKTLSSMAVEAVLLSIGLFVDIVAKKAQEQSKAVKLQLHCLRGVLMETRYTKFFHFDDTPSVAPANKARSLASESLARSHLGTFEGGPSTKAILPAIPPDEMVEKRMVPLANVKRRMQLALGDEIKFSNEAATKMMFAAAAFGKHVQRESLRFSEGCRLIEERHVDDALSEEFSDVLAIKRSLNPRSPQNLSSEGAISGSAEDRNV
ncbi:hypothetical protein quinque_015712 [Culex quinquefasciatus]